MVRRALAECAPAFSRGLAAALLAVPTLLHAQAKRPMTNDDAGLPSLMSMAGTTDIPGYFNTFFNGLPQYDGSIINPSIKYYLERSAISYSDNVTTPLLILHGGNDERVPIGQPMEFYRALQDRGKTTELVFYPREGHGVTEYYHQIDRTTREYEWISRHTFGSRLLP